MWYISLVETPFRDVLNKGGWAKIHPGNVSQTNSLHRVALFAPSGDNYCLLFSTKRKEYMMGAVCLRSHNIIIWMRKQCFHTLQPPINLIYLIISHSQKGNSICHSGYHSVPCPLIIIIIIAIINIPILQDVFLSNDATIVLLFSGIPGMSIKCLPQWLLFIQRLTTERGKSFC